MKKQYYNIGLRSPMPKSKLDKLIETLIHIKETDESMFNEVIKPPTKNLFEAVDEKRMNKKSDKFDTHHIIINKIEWEKLRELLK